MQHSMHFSKATLACWLAPAAQRNVRGFVQQLLEWTTLRRLITSEWSNYAVQRILDNGTPEQKLAVLDHIHS